MAKSLTNFVCQQCGYTTPKWMGQCQNCGQWNSMVETVVLTREKGKGKRGKEGKIEPVRLSDIKNVDYGRRISTGVSELDRVLGGGIVPGMVVLVAGEPGIGKSTLLLQIADKLGKTIDDGRSKVGVEGGRLKIDGRSKSTTLDPLLSTVKSNERRMNSASTSVVYVAGEESATQIAGRAARLGVKGENITVLEERDVDEVIEHLNKRTKEQKNEGTGSSVSFLIVDSIQTLTTQDLTGTAGSVGQVRECAGRLVSWAKRLGTPLFMAGHVTKEGAIAGPRVLEHMVDTILWFEGERSGFLRVLRAVKNRFGPTDEVGIFSMEERGLSEVDNPSRLFLTQNGSVSGSQVTVVIEGTRPILVEIQALVSPTRLAFPKRSAAGIDSRRLEIIVAVLGRRVGIPLWEHDIFVNATGGITVREPAADLAIALAIASAFYDKPIGKAGVGCVAIGEVGLLGEVREVIQLERRLKEAKRLGFSNTITAKEASTVAHAIQRFLKLND